MAEIVTGIPEFDAAIKSMEARVDEAARKFVLEGAERIKREAKNIFITGADAKITEKWHSDAWPLPTRRTGNLMNSIYSDGARKTGVGRWESQTGPHIVYGRRIELGFHGSGRRSGMIEECACTEWFGEKICKIVGPGAPDDRKFLALDSVANPVVAHVDAFRSFGLDCPIGDVASALIVDEDSGLALRVTEVGKDRAESGAVLSVHEEGNVFCLSDGGNYAGD